MKGAYVKLILQVSIILGNLIESAIQNIGLTNVEPPTL